MSRLTESPAWKALEAHRAALNGVHMRSLFEADPRRNERYTLSAAGSAQLEREENRWHAVTAAVNQVLRTV